MSEVIFKKLGEVQILHDYFLTSADGISFFERNEDEKNEVLTKKLAHGIYDIHDFFTVRPLEDTILSMNAYNLVLARTPLGFILGMAVTAENQAGDTVFKPRLEVPENISLAFSMRPKLSFFRSITTLSFRSVFPSIYYFSNKDKSELNEVTVPIYTSLQLTNKFMEHQPGMIHEMGTLIDFGGTLREAIQQTDGSDPTHWEDIEDRGFVNDADRILLPNKFTFSLNKEDAITDIEFVLEDLGGTPIKTITISGTEVLETVFLNFAKVDETDEASDEIPSGFYTLKVVANAGPEIAYTVHLNKTIYDKNQLGIIDLRFDEPDSPYSLLDANGFLKTRITAADVLVPHPVYEIRFKNRRTYWRYNSETAFTAGEVTDTIAHLAPESIANKKLISLNPKALTEALVPFINGTSLVLPHPEISALRVEKEKTFSEIFINTSNRLLNSS